MDKYLVLINKLKEELKKLDRLISHSEKEIAKADKAVATSKVLIKSNENEISGIKFKIGNYDNVLKQVSKKAKKDFLLKTIISALGFVCLEVLFSSVFLTHELLLSLTTLFGFVVPAGYLFNAFTKYANNQASILISETIKEERVDSFNDRINDLNVQNQQLENSIIKNTTKALIYEYQLSNIIDKKEELNRIISNIEKERQASYEQTINVSLATKIETALNDSYTNSAFMKSLKKQ